MSEKDLGVKESDEAGEKKVTFNEATEEKNYTKGREIDEEDKRVERHAINNQTSDNVDVQTIPSKSDAGQLNASQSENDERRNVYKTDDEKHEDLIQLNNDNQESKNNDLEVDNKTKEEKGHKTETVVDERAEIEAKSDTTKDTNDTDDSKFRFRAANEEALEEKRENTLDNYFHDSAINDLEESENQTVKKTTHETKTREDTHELTKANTLQYDSNTDDYHNNKMGKSNRNETDGAITIVTKKRNPPKEMSFMTDEEKTQLQRAEYDEVHGNTKKSEENTKSPESEIEEPKESKHRCPSPSSSSSVGSEPHIVTNIVTKKKEDKMEDVSKETERRATDARNENARQTSNRTDAKSAKGGVVITPKLAQTTDNKSSSPRRAVQQRPMPSTRTQSPRVMASQAKQQNPRMAKSAGPGGRQAYSRASSSLASTRSPSRWSRPRTCGYRQEERRRKEREFFTAELERLKKSLKRDSSKIKKPKPKDHYPYVFTSLEPYYNTYTPQYLIGMPETGYPVKQPPEVEMTMKEMKEHRDRNHGEEKELMYTSRCTAIGLTDPWDSLHMDKSVLPKLETSEMRRRRMEKMHEQPRSPSAKQRRPEAKLGSTRLPKFPVISLSNQELATKELIYTDIPMLRGELVRSFSHQEGGRKKEDYTRTRQDFYRMELDRITEMHKSSRPHMRAAYFAYLQNTPGSRKAVYECLRELNKKEEKQSPQAVA